MADAQPRKRKDKRRKKDDSITGETDPRSPPTVIPQKSTSVDDTNIHVYHDAHTGGGWCAKIVFFILLAIIGVLIGFILLEYRGSTDLDAPVQDSKYAEIFEGWIDDTPQLHDDEDEHPIDDHDDEHDDDHDDDGHEDEGGSDEHDDDEENGSEEGEQEEADEEEQTEASNEVEDEEGADDDEGDNEPEDEPQADEPDDEEQEDSTELANDEEGEENADDDENNSEANDDNDDGDDDGDDLSAEDIQKVLDSLEEDDALEEVDEAADNSNENEVIDNNPEEAELLRQQEEAEAENEEESSSGVKSVPEKKPEPAEATPKASKTGGAKAFEDELLDEDQFFKEHASYDNNLERTVEKFRMEVRKNGTSTKALYGLAIALDRLAEKLRSNKLLVESIQAYENLLSYGKNIPDMLYKKVADRCINRMRFKGENARAITIHKALIEKFPTDVNFRNNLTITYLIIDKIEAARRNVLDTLKKWPNNGLAKTLYGFILKTSDNNIEKSVKYLKEGIESREPGVLDGRFFFHLGDALLRLGRSSEAMEVYETGVKEGFFLSKYQRSLYNVDRLTGRPWWTKEQTTYKKFFDLLEENWMNIRKEGLSLLNSKGLFKDEAENLIDVGDWKQFELFSRGRKVPKNCKQAPYTCSLVEFFTPASHCRRGQIKFSVMHPDTHVWPHCGPTNCRLRAHLGLKIPPKTFIRVAESIRTWTEGKIIIFDDSFEHEVWHNGTETRLILIVDVWHPELTANEKQTLPAI